MANVLPFAARVDIASHLVDGCSIRATSRLTSVHKTTSLKFLVTLGEGCARLHDRLVLGVVASDVEMDEIWSFVQKKQHRLTSNDPSEWGDAYTFVAMARASKLVISYLTGARDGQSAYVFAHDLRKRLVTTPGRVQLSSDGFQPYIPAIRAAFGLRVDYGQVVKQYGAKQRDDHRYEPPRATEFIHKTPILGVPKFERMSTSMVERQNLTIRMHVRRLTRLCNGFSKKRRNHGAALALHFMWYNFCRIHETLRTSPAMAAGLTDHLWDVAELVERAMAEPMPTPAPLAPVPSPEGWRPPEQLGLFDTLGGLLPGLLPPSTGGAPSANDNATPPLAKASPETAGDDDDGPATVRDPAPWGAACVAPGRASSSWHGWQDEGAVAGARAVGVEQVQALHAVRPLHPSDVGRAASTQALGGAEAGAAREARTADHVAEAAGAIVTDDGSIPRGAAAPTADWYTLEVGAARVV
jgi:IS1 family transposase